MLDISDVDVDKVDVLGPTMESHSGLMSNCKRVIHSIDGLVSRVSTELSLFAALFEAR